MDRAGLKDPKIQTYGVPANNEVLIALEQKETSEQALDAGKNTIIKALETNNQPGKTDLNNVGSTTIRDYLIQKDPIHEALDAHRPSTSRSHSRSSISAIKTKAAF